MYRIAPIQGRPFTRAAEAPGSGQVVILSHGFWSTHLAAAPNVVGTTLVMSGVPYEIVGVLPANFQFPANAVRPIPLFVPMTLTDEDRLRGVVQSSGPGPTARLRDEVTRPQVEMAMAQMLTSADVDKKAFHKRYLRAEVIPLLENYVGAARSWMLMLLGAVGLVLLVACAKRRQPSARSQQHTRAGVDTAGGDWGEPLAHRPATDCGESPSFGPRCRGGRRRRVVGPWAVAGRDAVVDPSCVQHWSRSNGVGVHERIGNRDRGGVR